MKKTLLKKFGIGIIATVLVCVTCFTGCGKIKQKVTDIVDGISGSAENGGAVVNESENNGIAVTSTKLSASEYAENGISEQAETAYKLTTTVSPSGAGSVALDWSVFWVNAESEWATGKTVTDYVTVTPTSDGSITANVECKQAFGEQIKITVSSRYKQSVTADCFVDYIKKVCFSEFSIKGVDPSSYDCEYGNNICRVIIKKSVATNASFSSIYYSSSYTIDSSYTHVVEYELNSQYIGYLKEAGITLNDQDFTMARKFFGGSIFFYGSYTYFDVLKNRDVTIQAPLKVSAEQANQAIKIARQHTNIPVYKEIHKFHSDEFDFIHTYVFYFAESSLDYVVDNVTFNESNIVF